MLAKLTIAPRSLKNNKLVKSTLPPAVVLFNPNAYSISKSVGWKPLKGTEEKPIQYSQEFNAPPLKFNGGGSRILMLDLFFDVTEPINGVPISDVREETNKIVNFTQIERGTEQPPICTVSWGSKQQTDSDFPFQGVITQLTQNFTLFRRDGRPVRANLNVTFTEFLIPETDKRKTDPELTTRTVKRGDSLSSIANDVYNSPSQWRRVAQANQIDDPRNLDIGKTLTIPATDISLE